MAGNKALLSQIREAQMAKQAADEAAGMYGYDEQGRPLRKPRVGIGGFKASPNVVIQPWQAEAGIGAPGQNASTPYNSAAVQQSIADMAEASRANQGQAMNGPLVNAQGATVPSMNAIARDTQALTQRADAAYDDLSRFRRDRAAASSQNANAAAYEDKVLNDVANLNSSSDVHDYMRPVRNRLSDLRDLIQAALGAPTQDDPFRGRTIVRNPRGLPADPGTTPVYGHNF